MPDDRIETLADYLADNCGSKQRLLSVSSADIGEIFSFLPTARVQKIFAGKGA